MTDKLKDPEGVAETDWWSTALIDMQPGVIRYRGYAIEDLIGRVSFPAMIWLLLQGELPSPAEADLLGAALAAAVDHGPQAPSIATARMAMTCGVDINNAMASAANLLGDVHGGAGEQALALYADIVGRLDGGAGDLDAATAAALDDLARAGTRYVPGFGHRFHPLDPRAPRLLALVHEQATAGVVDGRYAAAGRAVERAIQRRKGRLVPMNIDGATAVVYGELGFPPPLARGLFVLSRSVGILAHAWEQANQGGRNKGPTPPDARWRYTGPPPRPLPETL